MARCGAKYWDLIVTSRGGTPEEPLTGVLGAVSFPSLEDWWSWHELATRLYTQANEQMARLAGVEAKGRIPGNGWPEWNKNIVAENEMEARHGEMGSFWGSSPQEGIPKAVALCEAAVCLMEGLDTSLAVYGESSHVEPGPKAPSIFDNVWGLLLIGAIGYGVYKLDSSSAGCG